MARAPGSRNRGFIVVCLAALGCGGGAGRTAQVPRAIVVGPAPAGGQVAGAPEPSATPNDDNTIFELAVGMNRACVRVSGRVHCFRDPGDDLAPTSAPALQGIDDATSLALGRDFGCAVTRAGIVKCFGENTYGQLGAQLRADASEKPVVVSDVAGARRVVAGDMHACALLGDGTVRCWGRNDSGQTASATSYLAAAHELVRAEVVDGVKDATALVSGGHTTCARRGAELTCWGRAPLVSDEMLGSRPPNQRPAVIADLAHIDDISATEGAFCGVRNGGVVCWGDTSSLVKNDAVTPGSLLSVKIPRARRVRVGRSHACALLTDGAVTCWGRNYGGALGRGETLGYDTFPPEIVKGLPAITDIAVGGSLSCAVASAQEVYCWGTWPQSGPNEHKELTPVRVRITD